jgi:hypothetical protein
VSVDGFTCHSCRLFDLGLHVPNDNDGRAPTTGARHRENQDKTHKITALV